MQPSGQQQQWPFLLIGLVLVVVILFASRNPFDDPRAVSSNFLRRTATTESHRLSSTSLPSFDEFRTMISDRVGYHRPHYFKHRSSFGIFDQDIDDESARVRSQLPIDDRIKLCIESYQKRYHRDPPRNYDKWLRLAIRHHVEVEKLQFYDQIHLDLWPYRTATDNGTGRITSSMIALMRQHHVQWQTDKIEIELGQVWQNDQRRKKPAKPYFVDDVLQLGIDESILPLNHFEMYLVWNDNPHSVARQSTPLPPRNETTKMGVGMNTPGVVAVVEPETYHNPHLAGWTKSEEFMTHNECLRDLFTHRVSPTDGLPLSAWHPFFHNNPDIRQTSPYLLPFFADCKLPCFGDIVIPRAEYREELTDGIEAVLPWEERNNTVIFRGSLSWPFTGQDSVIWVTQHLRYKVWTWAESIQRAIHRWFDVDIGLTLLSPYVTFCQQQQQQNINNNNTRSVLVESADMDVMNKNVSSNGVDRSHKENENEHEYEHEHDAIERACNKLEAISHHRQQSSSPPAPPQQQQQQPMPGRNGANALNVSSSFLPPSKQYANRYILTLDGNSWSGRLSRDVASGSTVIYGTAYETWLTTRLQPFVHFIPLPLESSMTSLTDIMYWLVHHPSVAERIGTEGKRFATAHLRRIDMVLYTLLAWIEYANLCDETRW